MKIQYDIAKNPSCLQTNQFVAKELNLRLPKTNPVSGRSETSTCDSGLRVQHIDHSATRWL